MLRMGGERIYSESRVDVVVPNMFGGSVLDLEPDTPYEVRLTLADPDGVAGEAHPHADRPHPARAEAVRRAAGCSTSTRTASRARRSSRRSKA